MGIIRRPPSTSLWRRALVVAAAYLLVLQSALAGGAAHPTPSPDAFATAIICLNSGSEAPERDGRKQTAFDCCGLGCLVGAHALAGPAAPDRDLAFPAGRRLEPAATAVEARSRAAMAHGPGLRGPPTA